MKILALETAADPGSAALWLDGRIVAETCSETQSNSETLLPVAEALLRAQGIGFGDLDGMAFGAGPGSFTGLRVACGLAQGIAVARDLPVIGIGTLDGMALAAGASRVIVTLDARMGEVYTACFVDGVLQGSIAVLPPEAIPLPEGGGWTACGNALSAYPALREHLAPVVGGWLPEVRPHAEWIARLAGPRFQRGEGHDAADALPFYVRDKVAKTVAERLAEGGRA